MRKASNNTMKMMLAPFSFFSVLLISVACVQNAVASTTINFEGWQTLHQKMYATKVEENIRRGIWLENERHVQEHNAAFEAGHTLYAKTMRSPFADLTDVEFLHQYLMAPQDCSATHLSSGRLRPSIETRTDDDHPAVDWRTKGILTSVKSQGKCGSCWTFSTSGCLEAHTCLEAGKDCTHWTGLAEEQLVECAGAFNNHGCEGGLPSQAYEYLKYSGGMALEDDYKYVAPETGGGDACSLSTKSGWKAKVAEVFNITTFDEKDLEYAVAHVGPVSVAYQVSPDFRLYSHGVYDSYNHTTNQTMCHSGSHDVNHAVVAVGLGTSHDDGVDYYIIRNSWSADWGMEGHFWIKRGENLCGISDCASFPLVPTSSGETGVGDSSTSSTLEEAQSRAVAQDANGPESSPLLRRSRK